MQCYLCKGYGHFAKDCPSQDFYKIGPNGLPIWVRDRLRGSSTERKKPEEKKPSTKALNEVRVVPGALGVTLRWEKSLLNRAREGGPAKRQNLPRPKNRWVWKLTVNLK